MNDDNCITRLVEIKIFSKKLIFFKENFKYETIDLYESPVTDVSFQDKTMVGQSTYQC
jgi:hypothetical protein